MESADDGLAELFAEDTTVLGALAEVCRRIDEGATAYLKPAKHVTTGRPRSSIVAPPELLIEALATLRSMVSAWSLAGEGLEGTVHLRRSFSREANMLRRALMTRGERAVFTRCEISVNDTESNGEVIAERLKLLTLVGAPEATLDVPEGVEPLASHLECSGGSIAASEAGVRLADGTGPLKLRAVSRVSSVVASDSCLFQRVSNPSFHEVLRLSGVGAAGVEALRAHGLVGAQEGAVVTLAASVDYARAEEVLRASGERDFRAEKPEEFLVSFEALGCGTVGETLESVKAALLGEMAELEAEAQRRLRKGASADCV
jgi:hypothetical protein